MKMLLLYRKIKLRTLKKSARFIHLQENAQYGWTLGGCSLRFLEVHETFSWPTKSTSSTMSKQEKKITSISLK